MFSDFVYQVLDADSPYIVNVFNKWRMKRIILDKDRSCSKDIFVTSKKDDIRSS